MDVSLPRRDSKVGPRPSRHRGGGRPRPAARGGLAPARLHHQRAALRSGHGQDRGPARRPGGPGRRAAARGGRARRSARTRCARCARCSSRRASSWPWTRRRRACARPCRSRAARRSASSARSRSCCWRRAARRSASGSCASGGCSAAVAPELRAAGRHAAGAGVAPRGRRVDAHPAGHGPGGAAARGPGPPARAGGDAGHALPRPGQAGHHALRGRPPPLARPRGGRPGADARAARPLERPHACSATTCAARSSPWSATTSSRASSTTSASASSDGAIRRLARKCEPELPHRVARADCLGRDRADFPPVAMEWFLDRVQRARRGAAAAGAAPAGPRRAGARAVARARRSGASSARSTSASSTAR